MFIIHRNQVQEQAVNNLVSAGIIRQDETTMYNDILSAKNYNEVLLAMLASHKLRENCIDQTNYYQIGEVSLN